MDNAVLQLQELQEYISQQNESWWPDDQCGKIFFTNTKGLFHIEFYGSVNSDSLEEFCKLICRPLLAASVRSLVFRGPDEGANGTKNWCFETIIKSDVMFPNLRSFFVEPTQPGHHNQSIIASFYEEEGMISRLIKKMPQLEELTVPSAPNSEFFLETKGSLQRLRIETGYNHQNFIHHLSKSKTLPNLKFLDFGDYSQTYMENYRLNSTPFTHYTNLFVSPAFANVRYFRLRNPSLSQEQLRELKKLRKELQFQVIHETSAYVE